MSLQGTLQKAREFQVAPVALAACALSTAIPVVPDRVSEVGGGAHAVTVVLGAIGVGQLVGAIPGGLVVARWGAERVISVLVVVDCLALWAAAFLPGVGALTAVFFVLGVSASVVAVGRTDYVIARARPEERGEFVAVLGLVMRLGMVVGTVLGALVTFRFGSQGGLGLAGAIALLAWYFVRRDAARPLERAAAAPASTLFNGADAGYVLRVVGATGFGAIVLTGLRQCEGLLLALWGSSIGLSGAQLSVVFAVLGVVSIVVGTLLRGWADRYGRPLVVLGMAGAMSAGFLALPFVSGVEQYVAAAVVVAAGSGLGTGIVMTIGADLAPATGRAQFLGAWRFCAELGNAGFPVLVASVTSLVSVTAATASVGALGVAGGALFAGVVRRVSGRRPAAEAGP